MTIHMNEKEFSKFANELSEKREKERIEQRALLGSDGRGETRPQIAR